MSTASVKVNNKNASAAAAPSTTPVPQGQRLETPERGNQPRRSEERKIASVRSGTETKSTGEDYVGRVAPTLFILVLSPFLSTVSFWSTTRGSICIGMG